MNRSQWTALLELALAYLFIEITLWTGREPQRAWYWISIAWIAGSTLSSDRSLTDLGLGFKGFLRSSWVILGGAMVAGIIILIARQLGTLHILFGPKPALEHSISYMTWAIVQQFILQSFFFRRIEKLVANGRMAVLITALLFSLAHIPNLILVMATFAGGLIFCALFRHYRNVYTLGVTHGLIGLALGVSISDSFLRHMRVGLGYLHYHP